MMFTKAAPLTTHVLLEQGVQGIRKEGMHWVGQNLLGQLMTFNGDQFMTW